MRHPLFVITLSGLLLQACSDERYIGSTTSVPPNAELRNALSMQRELTSVPNGMSPTSTQPSEPYFSRGGDRVLMIGDSLSVGGFGQSMLEYLVNRFGQNNVAIFAACGSSPQHWLRSGSDYTTKCGYREQTPSTTILYDFQDGRRPPPMPNPKLDDLLPKYRPTILIVQLGTNWMDGLVTDARDEEADARTLDGFVTVIRASPSTVKKIIWITPPDSSHYPPRVQQAVLALIKAAAAKYGFETINSSAITHYIPGKSGGDGVHYADEPAKEWASLVRIQLDNIVRY
jgi:hypothetical protein